MNSRIRTAIALIGAVIVGAVAVLLVTSVVGGATLTGSTLTGSDPSLVSAQSSSESAERAGSYVLYSDEALAKAEGRVFLFFHADWCESCVQLEKRILHDGVPAGVTILQVDFDDSAYLRERYGVTYQTTFVEVDEDGAELQQFLAYNTPGYDSIIALL